MHILADAANDSEAYRLNRPLRWIYHKTLLYDALGVKYGLYTGEKGDLPGKYPVVLKPIVNLHGLSLGASLAQDDEDIAEAPGFLWMPLAKGDHVSVDTMVHDGKITDIRAVKGDRHPVFGLFTKWEAYTVTPAIEERAGHVVRTLRIGEGKMNIEMIGGTIIEVHLRHSDEYEPIYDGKARYARPLLSPLRRRTSEAELMLEAGSTDIMSCLDDGFPEHTAGRWFRYAMVYGS